MNGVIKEQRDKAGTADGELRMWLFIRKDCRCLRESLRHKRDTVTARACGCLTIAIRTSYRCI